MKEFIFKVGDDIVFRCNLNSTLCTAHSKSGARCKRKCIIGFEYCFTHLQSELQLKIKDSDLPNAGKGLFAFDRTVGPDDIVFRAGDTICGYRGQVISTDEINERYDGYNAPYAVQINQNNAIDCACKRGVGSLANTYPGHNNARFSVNSRDRTVSIKATKNIRNGREIYLAYGNAYNMNDESSHVTKNKYVKRR